MTDWHIEVGAEESAVPAALLEELTSTVRWVLTYEEVAAIEISVALVSDESISALNEQYLSHSGPTDVISFPLGTDESRRVGDIYVGIEQAERQAVEQDISLREELLRLVIHGTLHVLGWEHPDGDDRVDSPMFQRQEMLLRSFLDRS